MEMDSFDTSISENADKILFAEDLMNYAAAEAGIATKGFNTVEKYREVIHNAFDGTMRDAVKFLLNHLLEFNRSEFGTIFLQYPVTKNMYISVARRLRKRYLSKVFRPRKFLYYCVHLANISVAFANVGYKKMLHLGVGCILFGIRKYDMSSGGWDLLNQAASMYANMHAEYRNMLFFSRKNKLNYTFKPGMTESEIRKIFEIHFLDLEDFVISTEDWKEEICNVMNEMKNEVKCAQTD